jgi:hypothetical protein
VRHLCRGRDDRREHWTASEREYIQFPPFGQDHLDNSLQHLSDLVA